MTDVFQSDDLAQEVEVIKTKYKDNPDEMLKALVHSQRHIQKLETENSDYKTKVSSAPTLEAVLEELRKSKPTQSSSQAPTGTNQANALDENTLTQKVEEIFQKKQTASNAAQLRKQINDRVTEHFGSATAGQDAVTAKAKALGISVERLGELAGESPEAFYTLMGITEGSVQNVNTSPTRSSVNVSALKEIKPAGTGPTQGTPEYYRNLRKENPRLWTSDKVQKEILEAGMKNPAAWGIKV